MEGILVSLYDESGELIAATYTDENGDYSFGDLPAGEYEVVIGAGPTDYTHSGPTSYTVTLGEGANETGINFGFCAPDPEPELGSISGIVYEDNTCNDLYNSNNENGIEGILVSLYDEAGDLIAIVTTDANGNYSFDDLPAGNYEVMVGYGPTDYTHSGPTSYTVTLGEGANETGINFGFCAPDPEPEPELGSISGTVYEDLNCDDVLDGNEIGIGGVLVSLYDDAGNLIAAINTDNNGNYTFDDLPAGNYEVVVGNGPTNYTHSGQTAFLINLEEGEDEMNINFGFCQPEVEPELGGIGDFVWIDDNGNGEFDSGEMPLAGVTVFLYDEDNNLIGVTTTDANGYYFFDNLPKGTYFVVVGGGPDGYDLTTTEMYEVVLGDGEVFLDANFGFTPPQEECETTIVCDAQIVCVEPLETIELCLDACVQDDFTFTNHESTYHCSVQELPNGCLAYTPLPGMETIGQDQVNIELEDENGNCYSIIFNITIGNCDVEEPCIIDAGALEALEEYVCEGESIEAYTISSTVSTEGYEVVYLLTETSSLNILEISDVPVFNNLPIGNYTIHTLVYDPLWITLESFTNALPLNEVLIQGGGNVCGSLIVDGPQFMVITCDEPCNVDPCELATYDDTICPGETFVVHTTEDPLVPEGYQLVYLLVDPTSYEILEHSYEPSFVVNEIGEYSVHALVVRPNDMETMNMAHLYDLSVQLLQGGGDICASLGLVGVSFWVEDCTPPVENCSNPPMYDCIPPVTPSIYCPDFCAFSDGTPYEITEVIMLYECGLEILDDCIRYVPLPLFEGEDILQVIACAPTGVCDTVEIYITVGEECNPNPNNPPTAINDNESTDEDTPITITVLTNDSDPDGDDIFICNTATDAIASNGTVVQTTTGFIYTPNPGFTGTDSFTYTICDGNGGTDQATVTITVLPEDPGPVTCETDDLELCVLPFFADQTPTVICIDFCTEGMEITDHSSLYACGIQDVNASCFEFLPLPNFEGENLVYITACNNQGFCEEIIVDVTVGNCNGNTPPVAADDNATSDNGNSTTINVLSNDSDPDGDNLFICNLPTDAMPANGTVTQTSTGFVYTPNPGFVGTDSFTYTICDGNGGTDQATVYITVTEPPVFCDADQDLCVPTFFTNQQPTLICIDFCGNGMVIEDSYAIFECGIEVVGSTCLEFLPLPLFEGNNDIFVTGCNSNGQCEEVNININVTDNCDGVQPPDPPSNNAPIAINDDVQTGSGSAITVNVLGNDYDPDGDNIFLCNLPTDAMPINGTVSHLGGQLIYTPNTGFAGYDSFTYTICDGNGGTDQGTVTIYVAPAYSNTPPVAVNDNVETDVDNPISFDVLGNDYDLDGDNIFVCSNNSSYAANGVLTFDGNGTFTYTPNPGFVGVETITYTLCDSNGGTATGTIYITVNGDTNYPPMAIDDYVETPEGTAVTIGVVGNDGDFDGDPLYVCGFTNPSYGSIYQSGNDFVYTPNAGFVGTDAFTYTVCDGNGGTSTATVYVTVAPASNTNNPPLAYEDQISATCGSSLYITVLGNDYDSDGDYLYVCDFTNPANGSIQQVGDQFYYTPNADFTGSDYFNYTVCDGQGGSATASVFLTVTCQITPPAPNVYAYDDYTSTLDNETTYINVLNNDSYPSDCAPSVAVLSPDYQYNGTALVTADGQIIYVPQLGFAGIVYIDYQICCSGECSTATITIDISAHGPCTIDGFRLPNIFTPNNDGINDLMNFADPTVISRTPSSITLSIYTSNGEQVYQSEEFELESGWDGTYNGTPLPQGAYLYRLETQVGEQAVIEEGFIELRR